MNIMLIFSIFLHRQAGKQIRGAIHSAYKIEKQAAGMCYTFLCYNATIFETKDMHRIDEENYYFVYTGLKDVLKELPTREASRFRSQVSSTCL